MDIYVDSAKVMAKGQITLPKAVREDLALQTGDRVMLIRENNKVILLNAADYAMQYLQSQLVDVSPMNDEEVVSEVKKVRRELASQ